MSAEPACLGGLNLGGEGFPLIDKYLRSDGIQKILQLIKTLKLLFTAIKREHGVSSIVWRQLTSGPRSLHYPEVRYPAELLSSQ